MSELRAIGENVWVVERPQRFFGLEVGCKMTVVRLADGNLWLHSPVALDAELRRELESLGPVRYAVAPNRFHHLHAGEVERLYPEARLFIAEGVQDKRPDLASAPRLGEQAPREWAEEIEQTYFEGRPMENECVFFHRPSRTLVLCDLAFNFGPRAPLVTRLFMRLMGGYGELRPSRLDPLLIKNREQARASLDRILGWDFERIVVAHGEVLEAGGRETLRRGYAWL